MSFLLDSLFSLTIDDLLPLSKNQLDYFIKLFNKARNLKYARSKTPKYGDLNRGFTLQELRKFFSVIDKKKDFRVWLVFRLMAFLGLRVGEVVRIRKEDIDFENELLKGISEKNRKPFFLPLPDCLFADLKRFVLLHETQIFLHDNYVFFSLNPCQKRLHLSKNFLRNKFREFCEKSVLNYVYGKAEKRLCERFPCRKLYRLTTHSLRHFAITHFYNCTKDPVLTQKFARHTDLNTTTSIYITKNFSELAVATNKAFKGV